MECRSVARVQTHFKRAFSDLPEKDATSGKLARRWKGDAGLALINEDRGAKLRQSEIPVAENADVILYTVEGGGHT
jgi:hypothetical protein